MGMATSAAPLWLHSKRYDLFWYGALPVLLYVALRGLSAALGPSGPLTAYTVSSVLTGLPHNWITWLLLMPQGSRGYYEKGVIFWPFVLTAIVILPQLLTFDTPLIAWGFTISTVVA